MQVSIGSVNEKRHGGVWFDGWKRHSQLTWSYLLNSTTFTCVQTPFVIWFLSAPRESDMCFIIGDVRPCLPKRAIVSGSHRKANFAVQKENFWSCERIIDPLLIEKLCEREWFLWSGRDGNAGSRYDPDEDGDRSSSRFWIALGQWLVSHV